MIPHRACGRLIRAAGLVLEAVGVRIPVGGACLIELPPGNPLGMAQAEVVGFSGERLFLMPTSEVSGLLPGARVFALEAAPIVDPHAGAKRLPVGLGMLGRVVDATGKPPGRARSTQNRRKRRADRAHHQPAAARAHTMKCWTLACAQSTPC